MIISNLSVLLAERGLRITKVSQDTKISRTTLTSLCASSGQPKGVQLETLNTLCMYLNVSPGDILKYYPLEIENIEYTWGDLPNCNGSLVEYTGGLNIVFSRPNSNNCNAVFDVFVSNYLERNVKNGVDLIKTELWLKKSVTSDNVEWLDRLPVIAKKEIKNKILNDWINPIYELNLGFLDIELKIDLNGDNN